jgi:hypothetical protein
MEIGELRGEREESKRIRDEGTERTRLSCRYPQF